MPRLLFPCSALVAAAPLFLSLAAATQSPELPSRAEAEEVCEVVAGPLWRFQGNALGGGVFDVNNDGVPDRVGARSVGTARVMMREISSRDGTRIPINPVGFEWKTYGASDGAWLPYNGRTYYIGALDREGRYRLYLSYVAPDSSEYVICEFARQVTETLYQQRRQDAEFCQQVGKAELSYIPVEKHQTPNRIEGRRETSLWGRIEVDFDNDGAEESISLLELASGAGPGCSLHYYDAVGADDTLQGSEEEHALLMSMQRINLENPFPGPTCEGNDPRWFKADGRVYLDNRYRGKQPRSPMSELHEVSVVEDGEVRLLCKGRFHVQHEVSRYNDALWKDKPQ